MRQSEAVALLHLFGWELDVNRGTSAKLNLLFSFAEVESREVFEHNTLADLGDRGASHRGAYYW